MVGSRFPSRPFAASVVVVACLVAGGCGVDGERGGVLHGRVTVAGKPLTGGSVYAVGGRGEREFATNAVVDADGRYEMTDVPVGVVRIAILPPPDDSADSLPLPPSFLDTRTSGLQLEVQPGRQAYDVRIP